MSAHMSDTLRVVQPLGSPVAELRSMPAGKCSDTYVFSPAVTFFLFPLCLLLCAPPPESVFFCSKRRLCICLFGPFALQHPGLCARVSSIHHPSLHARSQ